MEAREEAFEIVEADRTRLTARQAHYLNRWIDQATPDETMLDTITRMIAVDAIYAERLRADINRRNGFLGSDSFEATDLYG
jgi:hypothetical protein